MEGSLHLAVVLGRGSSAMAAFLAGAIARWSGARVAAIANIPSVLVWAAMIYLMAFGGAEWEGQTGFIVVSIIAVPLTTWIAYVFRKIGTDAQVSKFDDRTVLGVRPYHWAWIVFPLYFYTLGIVFVVVKYLALQFFTWRDASMVGTFISLFALVPVVAWVAPVVMTYKILPAQTGNRRL
jgi:hypothetical protein